MTIPLLQSIDSLSLEQSQQLAAIKYQQGRFAARPSISADWLASQAIKAEQQAADLLVHSTADGVDFNYLQALQSSKNISTQNLTPKRIQQLHQQLHPKGGQWRQLTLSQALRHQPTEKHLIKASKASTEQTLEALIVALQQALEDKAEPLIVIPIFAYRLLVLFPFLNGNRRIGLLLAKQLLIEHGHEVFRYQALEEFFVGSDPQLYHQLYLCSQQQAPLQDWLMFWWQQIERCYQAFDKALANNHIKPQRGGKTQLIKETIRQFDQPFALHELHQQLPSIGTDLIRKVVRDCREEGWLALTGRGRQAKWFNTKAT